MTICGYSIWMIMLVCAGVFLASLVDAIGGGGGLISLPVYLFAGLPVHQALGTNKMSAGIGSVASTLRYVRSGCVDMSLAIPSVLLGVLMAAAIMTGITFGIIHIF